MLTEEILHVVEGRRPLQPRARPIPCSSSPALGREVFNRRSNALHPKADTLEGKATDPNNDLLTFAKTGGEAWLDRATNGVLSGIPNVLGTNTFTVTVDDGNRNPYGVQTNDNLIITEGWAIWMSGIPGEGETLTVTNPLGPDQTFYRVISE